MLGFPSSRTHTGAVGYAVTRLKGELGNGRQKTVRSWQSDDVHGCAGGKPAEDDLGVARPQARCTHSMMPESSSPPFVRGS